MNARPLLAAVLLAAAVPLGAQQRPDSAGAVRKRTAYEDLQMFSQVLNQIRVNHPDSLDMHELLMAAVQGMVSAADPHSYVIPAVRMDPERERAWREGKLHPVPIEFRFVDGAPIVASVAAGSRAAELDILSGDELTAIDGKSVTAESEIELEVMLSGKKHSTVTLKFDRRRPDGTFATLERTVRRERVEEESALPGEFLLDATTGYVRIATFAADNIADDLNDALSRLEKLGMKRLVLDLRDNGGGRVDQASKVAGAFLPSGTVVYTSDGRRKENKKTGKVSRSFWRSERSYPIVLLVNEGTASASELVAGALQDHDRALVVGRPTFGKSLMMQGFPMSDGSIFVLVVGHVKTPCGRIVQRQYRSITRREYYRLARAERDTAGRPNCKTDAGRTVYGGGGIYPDIVLAEPAGAPSWVLDVREQGLITKWLGGWLSENASLVPTVESLGTSAAVATASSVFRAFAQAQGVNIPAGQDADTWLHRLLRGSIARMRFGDAGHLRATVPSDPEVRAAIAAFDRAELLLRPVSPR